MIVIPSINAIYYPVPRVASTSIKTMLLEYHGLETKDPHLQLPIFKHRILLPEQLFNQNITAQDLLSFAFVRHPFSRLESVLHKIQGHKKWREKSYLTSVVKELRKENTIDTFIKRSLR